MHYSKNEQECFAEFETRVIVIEHSTLLKVASAESHVWTASAGSLLGQP